MLPKQQPNFLILNSIGFFEKMKPRLEQYTSIRLFLDRDNKGLEITKEVMALSKKYHDESLAYKNYKDLNEFMMNQNPEQRESQRRGMRF